MTIDILLLTNHDIANAPRPNRALNLLIQNGYRLEVISGVSHRPAARWEIHPWGAIHYFQRLKAGGVGWLKPLVRFASVELSQNTADPTDYVAATTPSFPKRFFKSLLYLAQLINFLLTSLYLVIRFWKRPAPKLFYADDFDTGLATLLLARIKGRPFIYDAHELFADQLTAFPSWYRRALIFLEGLWLRRAASVTTVGEIIAQATQERFNLARLPIVVRSCPAYYETSPNLASQSPLKILYHGAFFADRGLEQIILAMKEIGDAHLYLRGFGEWEVILRRLVDDEQLNDHVTFLAPVPMAELVQSAVGFHIGIGTWRGDSLNTRYCLPNKVFEYMMAGMALAVSDLPEVGQLTRQYQVGVVFDPLDSSDIARAINDLVTDPDRTRRMRQNALIAARDVFNYEREGEKLLRIVQSLIDNVDCN
jgi:glycogen synthase